MDEILLEKAAYEGIAVDLRFEGDKPGFGDLFLICGGEHPRFAPSSRFRFEELADLEFEQADDYFGILNEEDEGDDIKVGLAPLVGQSEMYQHSGPFDGLRLSYSILRNPPENARLFLNAVAAFARELPVQAVYQLREINIGTPPDLAPVEADINAVVEHWRSQGIEPGSRQATRMDS